MTVPTFTTEFLKTSEGVAELNRILALFSDVTPGDTETVRVYDGYGSPESVVTAGVGSLYLRLDGGTGTTVYIKESGTADTGWVAIAKLTTPISLANGGTGQDLSTNNQGDIYYDGGSNGFTRLTPGTSGQILKTQGAAANPAWTDQSIIKKTRATWTTVANSGDISLTAGKRYRIYIAITAVSVDQTLFLRFNSDATATSYAWILKETDYSTTPTETITGDNSDSEIELGTLESTTPRFWFYLTLDNTRIGNTIFVSGMSGGEGSSGLRGRTHQGIFTLASDITSFELVSSTGTTTGTCDYYEYQ